MRILPAEMLKNISFCKFFCDEIGLTKTERIRVKLQEEAIYGKYSIILENDNGREMKKNVCV